MMTSVKPLRDSSALLLYLKQKQADFLWGIEVFGDPYNRAIARLALIGWMERKPFDLSDLALGLHVSRQQVMRRVVLLKREGIIWAARVRNRVLIHPTDSLIEQTRMAVFDLIKPSLPRTRKLMEEVLENVEAELRRGSHDLVGR